MHGDFPLPYHIDSNGIRMAVHEQGSGPPVILLHGFPELGYSWRHQLPALATAGYRAIAPDQRGYGGTDIPARTEDYRMRTLIDDILGLMAALSIEESLFVGHDWGALLLWQMALRHPHKIRGLINLNIPFQPRPPTDPMVLARERLGDDFYIVNFQDSDEADRCFAADVEHFFTVMMRRGQITRQRFDTLPADKQVLSLLAAMRREEAGGVPLLDEQELGYYVRAFERGGFTGPINWYRNWSGNWASSVDWPQQVAVPTLFIGAVDDVVIPLRYVEAMRPHVADLEIHMLEDCGHWTQQERPDEVNTLLLDWLQRRFPAG